MIISFHSTQKISKQKNEYPVKSPLLPPPIRFISVIKPFVLFGDALAPAEAKFNLDYWDNCASEGIGQPHSDANNIVFFEGIRKELQAFRINFNNELGFEI